MVKNCNISKICNFFVQKRFNRLHDHYRYVMKKVNVSHSMNLHDKTSERKFIIKEIKITKYKNGTYF